MIPFFLNSEKKSPLLAFIKSEPIFLTGSLAICLSAPVQGEAGGKGVWEEFRPPYKFWAKSVRIFSNAHRQLGNVFVGSPSTRARQPILSANWNFLSLPRSSEAGQKRASRIFILISKEEL